MMLLSNQGFAEVRRRGSSNLPGEVEGDNTRAVLNAFNCVKGLQLLETDRFACKTFSASSACNVVSSSFGRCVYEAQCRGAVP